MFDHLQEVWTEVQQTVVMPDQPSLRVATKLPMLNVSDVMELQHKKDEAISKILQYRKDGRKPRGKIIKQESKTV